MAWLKQVVLVLLAAAFLDWVLPTTAMQRYVKVVMGLVVVGTLLTPLMQIFHLTESWKAAVASLAEPSSDNFSTSDLSARIMQWEAEKVQNGWEEELRRRVAQRAEEVSGHEVVAVRLQAGKATPGRLPEPPELQRVTVVLSPRPAARENTGASNGGLVSDVVPIQPVHIGPDGPVHSSSGGTAAEFRTVAEAVAADLGIPVSCVDVQMDTSQTGGGTA